MLDDPRFEVIGRANGTPKRINVYARWTGPAPAKAGTVDPTGKALVCDDCQFAAGDLANLTKHTVQNHGRPPSVDERKPRRAA